jgi:hypothetical protein
MKFSRTLVLSLPLIVGFSVVHCGPQTRFKSNLATTNDEAKLSIDDRRDREKEINEAAMSLRAALEPIETLLREVDHAVNLKINGRPSRDVSKERFALFIGKLREHLGNAVDDSRTRKIQHRPDGSWRSETRVKARIYKDGQRCDEFTVALEGFRQNDVEQASLSIQDCFSPDPREIAKISSSGNGVYELSYFKDALEALKPEQELAAVNDFCAIVYRKDQGVEFFCNPINPPYFREERFTAELNPVYLEFNKKDVKGQITAKVVTRNGKHFDFTWNDKSGVSCTGC